MESPSRCAFYVMDRASIDFERLFVLTLSAAFFVVPAFVHITDGKVHDVNVLDQIVPEALSGPAGLKCGPTADC